MIKKVDGFLLVDSRPLIDAPAVCNSLKPTFTPILFPKCRYKSLLDGSTRLRPSLLDQRRCRSFALVSLGRLPCVRGLRLKLQSKPTSEVLGAYLLIIKRLAMQTALEKLGYKAYHMKEIAAPPNRQDKHMQCGREALIAKVYGRGKPYGREELDKLLKNYSVSGPVLSLRHTSGFVADFCKLTYFPICRV